MPDKNVDGEKANSWEYCRKWVDEAKPFFLCLLGQVSYASVWETLASARDAGARGMLEVG